MIARLVLPLGLLWTLSEVALGWATYRPGSRKANPDRGTLALMVGLSTLSAGAAIATWYLGIGRLALPALVPAAGLAVFGGGVGLRWWAILTLRKHFTINVAALAEHELITRGPYRVLRHPAYTGTLLTLCGLGLAMANPLSLALLVAGPLAALLMRMGVEEAMLQNLFGEAYRTYMQRTWRLLPGIY